MQQTRETIAMPTSVHIPTPLLMMARVVDVVPNGVETAGYRSVRQGMISSGKTFAKMRLNAATKVMPACG